MKKVIFFDGDGTLWYPLKTRRTKPPHWVYYDKTLADPIAEFGVTPTAVETLRLLGERGIKRVLLSTSPLVEEEAIMHRIKVAQHVDIHHLLDDIQVAPERQTGKGEMLVKLLERYDIDASEALMVGDTFNWDYKPAQDVGVEALLVESDYQQDFIAELPSDRVITNLIQVLDKLNS